MNIITIANQKGGVGKTTTAITIAHGLAIGLSNVLLLDLDPQGQSATALGIPTEPAVFNYLISNRPIAEVTRLARVYLEIIPGNYQTSFVQLLWAAQNQPINILKDMLLKLKALFDYIIIDTSPSIGGLQERALYAADLVIIPTACDYLSANAVSQIIQTMQTIQAHANTWILPTFYDDTTKESQLVLQEIKDTYNDNLLDPIHRATVLRECTAEGLTIFEKDANSRAASEYANLVRLISYVHG